MKILIVDDMPLLHEMLKDVLQRPGVDLEVAGTVEQAIGCVTTNVYDLVTLDHRMPDGSSLDVLRKLRQDGANTRVIMVTSDAHDPAFRRRATDLGAEAVFGKPVSVSALREQVFGPATQSNNSTPA